MASHITNQDSEQKHSLFKSSKRKMDEELWIDLLEKYFVLEHNQSDSSVGPALFQIASLGRTHQLSEYGLWTTSAHEPSPSSPVNEQLAKSTHQFAVSEISHGQSSSSSLSHRSNLLKLSLKERKYIVLVEKRPPVMKILESKMQKKLDEITGSVPLDPEKCWVYPKEPKRKSKDTTLTLSNKGIKFSKSARSTIDINSQIDAVNKWTMQFGLVCLLLEDRITKDQLTGLIKYSWHLSHLCGEWRCLNSRHFTVEPGAINQSRKKCMRMRICEGHHPPCVISLSAPKRCQYPRKYIHCNHRNPPLRSAYLEERREMNRVRNLGRAKNAR